jgi:flagellar basal body-associated protein FliL
MTDFRHALFFAAALAFTAPALAAGKAKGGAGPSEEARRITSADSYVPQFGLVATITIDSAQRGIFMVDAGLDVPDAALRARVQKMQPVVRDALRTALAEFVATRYRPGTAPDADLLKRMFQQAIDRALGAPGAVVVLANVLVQQR